MDPLDILRKLLISNKHSWMRYVFLHPGGWSVAANTACLLAYKGEIGASFENTPILTVLQSRPKKVRKVRLEALREWVSKEIPQMEEFETVPTYAQGVLEGVNFDLRRFAFILGLLPSEGELLVWASTKEAGVKSLGFEIDHWRGCLGGVAGASSECSNVFEEKPEENPFKLLEGNSNPPLEVEPEEDPFELLMSLESE